MSEFDFSTFESRTIELQPAPRDTLGIISKVTIFQDRIYILNSTRQQRLSVYSSGGKFIHTLERRDKGLGSTPSYRTSQSMRTATCGLQTVSPIN